MRRIWAICLTIIVAAVAVHLVWIAMAPFIPYAMGGLVVIGALGLLYYRRGRW